MKYYKRLGLYKASNVQFNPTDITAYSYGWWKFVDIIAGQVVFNAYRYSTTTGAHQRKARQLMGDLGIRIDMVVHSGQSMDDHESFLDSVIHYYTGEINSIRDKMAGGRSAKNAERKLEIDNLINIQNRIHSMLKSVRKRRA